MKRLLLLLPIACLAQDVVPVVCPDCNVEALEPPWICPKCSKQLEPPDIAPDPAPEPAERSEERNSSGPSDIASALRADARRATGAFAKNPAAALAAVRNAIALAALAPDELSPADRKALLGRETALLASLAAENAPCPRCHGGGRIEAPPPPKPVSKHGKNYKDIESVAVSGLNARTAMKTCPFCGGFGKFRRAIDRRRLAGVLGLGVRDLALAERAEGREEYRGVWLPAGVLDSLDDAARASLLRAFPGSTVCTACAGTGTQPCRACHGTGRVECTNRAFHDTAPKSAGEGADRAAIESTLLAPSSGKPCPKCGGPRDTARPVACPDCGGRGVAACPSCSGSGSASRPRE
jgi:hypothetical protein